jgi:hypothetical protein
MLLEFSIKTILVIYKLYVKFWGNNQEYLLR